MRPDTELEETQECPVTVANITERKLFSAMMMQGILSAGPAALVGANKSQLAEFSVAAADALIVELKKQNGALKGHEKMTRDASET